jgi:hypothetical protein
MIVLMAMGSDHAAGPGSGLVKPLVAIGGRVAGTALRPMTGAARAAAGAGMRMERHAVDRLLDSGEPERVLTSVVNDTRVQAMLQQALQSAGVQRLIDDFFDSGLFDHFIDRLAASDGLWRLVDEIAQSPSVMAALSQQGLGFADQVGRAARERSRQADVRIEGTVGRLRQRGHRPSEPDRDGLGP